MLDHILFLPPMAHLLRHFILRTRHLHDIQQYISFECLDEIVNCFIGPTFHTMTQSWHANMKKFWISTFFALKFVNHNSSFILTKKRKNNYLQYLAVGPYFLTRLAILHFLSGNIIHSWLTIKCGRGNKRGQVKKLGRVLSPLSLLNGIQM